MEKFHHFLYGNHFILETDQKPLETILARSLNQATPRLQRILIRTFPYNFTVCYLPGLKNQLADCLSRVCGPKDSIKLPMLSVYQITSQLNARSDSLQQLCEASQPDDTLAILKDTIQKGWPSIIKELPSEIQPYWTFREELTIEDGPILKGTRIVVPSVKQAEILKLICEGHLGLTKCKLRAKETVYWPDLNDQVEKLVLNCQLCLKYLQSKCKQTPRMSLGQEIPAFLWTKIATDIFHSEGDSYLLLVDYTSRYPIIYKLTSMTAQHVIGHLKVIFSENGWPDTIVSDNGPCYMAEAFTKTMQEYRVNHITSSSHNPQSNGLAEKFMQTVKSLFFEAREEGADLYKVLMIYCNMPLTSNLHSPIQILQNRTARSQLPISNSARRQLGLEAEKVRIKTKNENLPLHGLHLSQDVMMQDPTSKHWSPAVLTRLCKEPRSYQVIISDNVTYRKIQAHLKPYKPEIRSVQDVKSCNMWPLEKTCDKTKSNDTIANSQHRIDLII